MVIGLAAAALAGVTFRTGADLLLTDLPDGSLTHRVLGGLGIHRG